MLSLHLQFYYFFFPQFLAGFGGSSIVKGVELRFYSTFFDSFFFFIGGARDDVVTVSWMRVY
jgi:hypothetical protein